MNMAAIKIDQEFNALIPALASEEYERLEQSLRCEGCRDALVVWNGLLLDGHNRHEICSRLGISYRTKEVKLPDRLAARIWIRWNQLSRRNITDDQRALLSAQLLADLTAQSRRDRASKAGKAGGRHHPKVSSGTAPSPKLKSVDKARLRPGVARRARVSERKLRQAQRLLNDSPQLAQQVERGELSLAGAVRETHRKDIRARLDDVGMKKAKALKGVYDVVIIDPPWPIKKIERDERPRQVEFAYPCMSEEEIAALKLPLADDCHVWLWTTQRFLPVAFQLLKVWSLKYVCAFVWHKPGGFQPMELPQYNCEFVLYARKGSPKFIDTKQLFTCFQAPRGEHSEKPAEFYDMVRRATAGRRLDMFNRRAIDGFDGWGKEAENSE